MRKPTYPMIGTLIDPIAKRKITSEIVIIEIIGTANGINMTANIDIKIEIDITDIIAQNNTTEILAKTEMTAMKDIIDIKDKADIIEMTVTKDTS